MVSVEWWWRWWEYPDPLNVAVGALSGVASASARLGKSVQGGGGGLPGPLIPSRPFQAELTIAEQF